MLFARLYDVPRDERASRAADALEFMGLARRGRDSSSSTYSGGMIRRLEIAQALLHRPAVVFLDEPTVGPRSGREARRLGEARRAARHVRNDRPAHDPRHGGGRGALRAIAIMHQGRVVALGTPVRAQGGGRHRRHAGRRVRRTSPEARSMKEARYREVARTRRTAQPTRIAGGAADSRTSPATRSPSRRSRFESCCAIRPRSSPARCSRRSGCSSSARSSAAPAPSRPARCSYLDFMTPGRPRAERALHGDLLRHRGHLGARPRHPPQDAGHARLPRRPRARQGGIRGRSRGGAGGHHLRRRRSSLGIHLRFGLVPVVGVLVAVMLGSAVFSTFSLIVACIVKTRERFMGIGQVLTMPLFFASNAIYPIDMMPDWLKVVARRSTRSRTWSTRCARSWSKEGKAPLATVPTSPFRLRCSSCSSSSRPGSTPPWRLDVRARARTGAGRGCEHWRRARKRTHDVSPSRRRVARSPRGAHLPRRSRGVR